MPYSSNEIVAWGAWQAANPECFARQDTTGAMRSVQMVWAIICGMQAIYILSRYPRFGWEDVFVPVADVVFYGLQAGNAGYRLQYNGKAIPWVRYMQWALLTPVLLGRFARMGSYKFLEFNANTMLIALDLLMVMFGMSSDFAPTSAQQWMFLFFSLMCYLALSRICWNIIRRVWEDFDLDECAESRMVAYRLKIIAALFFGSWMVYPVLKVLGPQTICVADESTVASIMLLADMLAKNVFQLLFWNTSWEWLDGGDWTVISLKNRIGTVLRERILVTEQETEQLRVRESDLVQHAYAEDGGRETTVMAKSKSRPGPTSSHHEIAAISAVKSVNPFKSARPLDSRQGSPNPQRMSGHSPYEIMHEGMMASRQRDRDMIHSTIGAGPLSPRGYAADSRWSAGVHTGFSAGVDPRWREASDGRYNSEYLTGSSGELDSGGYDTKWNEGASTRKGLSRERRYSTGADSRQIVLRDGSPLQDRDRKQDSVRTRRELINMMDEALQQREQQNIFADFGYEPPQGGFTLTSRSVV